MGGGNLTPFLSVYGHITVDQILTIREFPPPGITADALGKRTSLGGTGPNIAVAASRLGCPTALCAFAGPDLPEKYLREMEDSGLIMDEVVVLDDRETSSAVIVNDREMNTRVFFYQGPQGCADELGVRLLGNASASEWTHFCTGQPSYYLSLMEELRGGPRIALDPAQEVHMVWTPETVGRALPMSDSLFCNELEAGCLCRYLGLDDVLDADVPLVVETLGDRGSVARFGDERIRVPAVKADRVADATGAGDTYRAGFYAALYRGYGVPEALVIAASVSSFVVEEVGALTGVPTWDRALERAEPRFADVSRRQRLLSSTTVRRAMTLFAMTGTPGTGKTTVSEVLRRRGYEVVDGTRFIEERGLLGDYDEGRDTHEVDLDALNDALEYARGRDGPVIFESHLAHFMDSSGIAVLRCAPDELAARLRARGYAEEKVRENVQAEILDEILCEAVDSDIPVGEVDCTSASAEEAADAVEKIISGHAPDYPPGSVDWSSEMDSWF